MFSRAYVISELGGRMRYPYTYSVGVVQYFCMHSNGPFVHPPVERVKQRLVLLSSMQMLRTHIQLLAQRSHSHMWWVFRYPIVREKLGYDEEPRHHDTTTTATTTFGGGEETHDDA